MNVLMEPRHLWVAIEFLVAPLPDGSSRFVDNRMLVDSVTTDRHPSPLQGWVEAYSEGRLYYFNEATQESSW